MLPSQTLPGQFNLQEREVGAERIETGKIKFQKLPSRTSTSKF